MDTSATASSAGSSSIAGTRAILQCSRASSATNNTAVAVEESDQRRNPDLVRDEAVDLAPAREQPPQHAPREHDGRHARRFGCRQTLAMAIEMPCREQARDRDQHRPDECAVGDRNRRRRTAGRPQRQAEHERDAGAQLQQQAERAHEAALEAHARPYDRRTFDGPRRGRPARVERQRNGQRREHDAEREEALDQQPDVVAATGVEETPENEIERGHRQRAERHPVLDVVDERRSAARRRRAACRRRGLHRRSRALRPSGAARRGRRSRRRTGRTGSGTAPSSRSSPAGSA